MLYACGSEPHQPGTFALSHTSGMPYDFVLSVTVPNSIKETGALSDWLSWSETAIFESMIIVVTPIKVEPYCSFVVIRPTDGPQGAIALGKIGTRLSRAILRETGERRVQCVTPAYKGRFERLEPLPR
jgi:hypothetical protein